MKVKNLKFYAQMAIIIGGIILIKDNLNTQTEELVNSFNTETEALNKKSEEQNARLESLEQRIDALIVSQTENKIAMAKLTQSSEQAKTNLTAEETEEVTKKDITQLVIALQEDGTYNLHFYKEGNVPSHYITTNNPEEELRAIEDAHKNNIKIVYFDSCKDKQVLKTLSQFENLCRVSIEDCEFSDLSEIGAYQNLEFLRIVNCNNLENIRPLGKLENLRTFILNNTQVNDVSPLAALDSLETLDLRTNQITDPSVLSDLTNLYSISLEGNNIVDHSSLYGFVERGLISQENIGQITSIEEKKRA